MSSPTRPEGPGPDRRPRPERLPAPRPARSRRPDGRPRPHPATAARASRLTRGRRWRWWSSVGSRPARRRRAASASALLHPACPTTGPDVLTHTVKSESLPSPSSRRGTLESADNQDWSARCGPATRAFASTINWVIDDGTRSSKGQLAHGAGRLRPAGPVRPERSRVDQANAAKSRPRRTTRSQRQGERVGHRRRRAPPWTVAELDLDKFLGLPCGPGPTARSGPWPACRPTLVERGDYQQAVDDLTGQLQLAETDLEQNRERSPWADRMVKLKYHEPEPGPGRDEPSSTGSQENVEKPDARRSTSCETSTAQAGPDRPA